MSTNSSNVTIPEREVGWQASPHTRGTTDILWSCISVIILITWTSFHPAVGVKWKQRIPSTITATLMPQLTALAAARDCILAMKLLYAFRNWTDGPEWRKGWTTGKSFLVVKKGIAIRQHNKYHPNGSAKSTHTRPDGITNRRHSRDLNSEQSVHVRSDEIPDTETDGRTSSGSNSAQSIAPYEIIDAKTLLLLAVTGIIRYEDFPTTEEINDKSKADWFSKCVTLAQLSWFCLNLLCRRSDSACTVSVLEILILDWILFGFTAVICWLGCPQNVNTPYIVPIQHDIISAEGVPMTRNSELVMGVLLDIVPTDRSDRTDTVISDDQKPIEFERKRACVGMFALMIVQSVYSFMCSFSYPWHSAQPQIFWMIFLSFTIASEIVLIFADPGIRFHWGTMPIYQTCIRMFVPEPPRICGESMPGHEWFAWARGMGISRAVCTSRKRQHTRYKVVVVAALVILLCHFGKLVIALTAFISAPEGTYNVPNVWFLDFMGHVGR